jgi:hypothetical protein
MNSRFRVDTPPRIFAVLALVLLLLDFSARAAQDQHEFGAPAGHGLCAICVYTGGVSGIPESAWVPPQERQRHATPAVPDLAEPTCTACESTRIRGPPSLA